MQLSDHIVNASGSIIYEFDTSYAGSIIITNTIYKTISNNACIGGLCTSLDLSQSKIEYIENSAFLFCRNLVTFILPDSLILIGANTFGEISISFVHFGPNLREFSGYSFNQCLNLNTSSIDENNQYFTVVNNFVFSKDMTKLVRTPTIFEEEDIPNKERITILGFGFECGSSIHKFKGWENLSKIEDVGFHANPHLEIIDVSNTKITKLSIFAFHGLINLKTLILPIRLNELRSDSISQLPKLYSLSLPSSINLIADQSFSNLNNLRVVCYYGNISFSGKNLFNNCPNVKYICVCPLYPSEKFSSFNVSFDAFQLGETMITCSSIKNIPCSSTFPFISYSVFILI